MLAQTVHGWTERELFALAARHRQKPPRLARGSDCMPRLRLRWVATETVHELSHCTASFAHMFEVLAFPTAPLASGAGFSRCTASFAHVIVLEVLAFRPAPLAFGAGFSRCTATFEQGGLFELHGNYRPAPFVLLSLSF